MAALLAQLIASVGFLPVLASLVAAYALALAVHRLYLHPLAKFPGPRLAAVTSWYEGYYEIIKNGQYSRQISILHDHYGENLPSVRVRLCIHISHQAQSFA